MAFVRTRSIQTRNIGSSNVLARAVGDAYAVDGFEPELAFDFTGETYRTDGSATTFSGAMTHSATSLGTMVDEDGALKWRPHNLVPYSEDFTTGWISGNTTETPNVTTAPDGALTADLLVPSASSGNHNLYYGATQGRGTFTFSVWAKAAGYPRLGFRVYDGTGYRIRVTFDISAGTIVLNDAGVATIQDAGNGWYLCSCTGTSPSGNMGVTSGWTIESLPDGYTVQSVFTGDGSSGAYLWGAHIYRSDLGGMVDNPDRGDSYVPTTSAAVYLPRRGHYVYNGQAWTNRGLLLESEARTNLLTYSNDFSNAAWTKNGGTVLQDVAGPDGTTSGWTHTAISTSFYSEQTVTVATSTSYVYSVYAKAGTSDTLLLSPVLFTTPSNGSYVWFDLTNGSVGTQSKPSEVAGSIEDVGNGWYRCIIHFLSTDAVDTSGIIRNHVSTGDGQTTCSVGDSLSLYGAQFEAGSTPSSYMPTDAATVTRAAETLTVAAADLPSTITPSGRKAALVTAGWTITDGGSV